jgi:hypothetical protein
VPVAIFHACVAVAASRHRCQGARDLKNEENDS